MQQQISLSLFALSLIFTTLILLRGSNASVVLDTSDSSFVVLSNGGVTLTILNPTGRVTSVTYGDSGNLLAEWPDNFESPSAPETTSSADRPTFGLSGGALTDRGYWDGVWESADGSSTYSGLNCEHFEVVKNNGDVVIVKFSHVTGDDPTDFPVNVDVFYSLAANETAFYSWSVLNHLPTQPAMTLVELRFLMKLDERFTWTSLAKDRQRVMPTWEDRTLERSEATIIGETRKLTNPTNPDFKDEYDTKYNYLLDIGDQLVYGWCSDDAQPIGIWYMNPYKYEYTPGGPTKQELTVQTGPYLLNYMHSQHVGTPGVEIGNGEEWSKTYGPFKVYLNKNIEPSGNKWKNLFQDARAASIQEYWQWPYSKFADSTYYPSSEERGNLKGYLSFPSSSAIDTDSIDFKRDGWVGLAPVGSKGSWAYEVKGYQYWSHFGNSKSSNFRINNVRPGEYTLYVFIMGVFGDFASTTSFKVTAGETVDAGIIVWAPPRSGPTLFELGYPDRDSAEFYIPDINPLSPYPYKNNNKNRFRDYGVWNVYAKQYPTGGPIYVVGESDWSKDWWYMQTALRTENSTSAVPTVYTIRFNLSTAPVDGDVYKLRVALAGKHEAVLQVFVNTNDFNGNSVLDTNSYAVPYSVDDNGLARSAAHGQYYTYSANIPGSALKLGTNNLYFRQRKTADKFAYVAYDYIRFEGPPAST